MSTSLSLQIAVVGVGGIGSSFAFHLSRAGHSVTVIPRAGSLRHQQLLKDQFIIDVKGERASVIITDKLDEHIAYDLVLVTTQAHQVDAVLPSLQRSAAKHIQFMFVVFEPERLRDAVGEQRSSFGMPFVMAIVDKVTGQLKFEISKSRKTLHGDQRWVDLFNTCGLYSEFEPNMLLWVRCHVPLCVSFESISVAAQRRGGGATWAEAMTTARGMQGCFALIKRMRYRLYPTAKVVFNRMPNWFVAMLFWSISRNKAFRELLAGGDGECRALVDVMLNAAKGVNLPAKAVAAIQAMSPTEHRQQVAK